jgi:Xaa-Pro aminopeptidase
VRYLANFAVHFEPACVLVPAQGKPLLVTGPETADHAVLTAASMPVRAVEEFGVPGEEYPFITLGSLPQAILEVLAVAPSRVGIAGFDLMSVDAWERIRPAFGSAEIVRSDNLLLALRKRKSAEEIAVLTYAYGLAQRGMEAAIERCRVGAYEYEVAAAAEYAMRSAGAEGLAIDTIVASGVANSRPIVGRAGRRQLRADEHISITVAPRYEGYSAPIGRVVYVGEPSALLRKATDAALEAQRRAIAALRPGVTCASVDAAARSYLQEQGYAEYCAYGVVHSVGVQEFEPPFFGPSTTDSVESSMVVSVDIPMFFGPWGGFRLEDSFVVQDEGNMALTSVQPGLIVLPA